MESKPTTDPAGNDNLMCPRCGGEDFTTSVEFESDLVTVYVETCNECGLAFDGEQWSDDDKPYELTRGT